MIFFSGAGIQKWIKNAGRKNRCGVFQNKNATTQTRMNTGFAEFVAFVASLKPHPLYTTFYYTKIKIQKNRLYFSVIFLS